MFDSVVFANAGKQKLFELFLKQLGSLNTEVVQENGLFAKHLWHWDHATPLHKNRVVHEAWDRFVRANKTVGRHKLHNRAKVWLLANVKLQQSLADPTCLQHRFIRLYGADLPWGSRLHAYLLDCLGCEIEEVADGVARGCHHFLKVVFADDDQLDHEH